MLCRKTQNHHRSAEVAASEKEIDGALHIFTTKLTK